MQQIQHQLQKKYGCTGGSLLKTRVLHACLCCNAILHPQVLSTQSSRLNLQLESALGYVHQAVDALQKGPWHAPYASKIAQAGIHWKTSTNKTTYHVAVKLEPVYVNQAQIQSSWLIHPIWLFNEKSRIHFWKTTIFTHCDMQSSSTSNQASGSALCSWDWTRT